ncbi:hypothetical protein GCM10009823_07640 [Brevibacterium salitolerans]|uniref:Uncharacterized protein n=1 Tax=Brevibacterium salitolerans TaxID=1403566 RepID=A0ABN2WFI7_9MICO
MQASTSPVRLARTNAPHRRERGDEAGHAAQAVEELHVPEADGEPAPADHGEHEQRCRSREAGQEAAPGPGESEADGEQSCEREDDAIREPPEPDVDPDEERRGPGRRTECEGQEHTGAVGPRARAGPAQRREDGQRDACGGEDG